MLKQGFVEKILERPSQYKTKGGAPKPSFWAMQVDNIQYGTKNDRPPCKEGDYVEFEAIEDGKYWRADVATIRLVAVPAGNSNSNQGSVAPVDNVTKPVYHGAKGGYNDPARQDAITYQSARKDALEHVGLLIAAGLLDFGKAKGAQKIELVDIIVDDYTVRYYNETKELAPKEHASPVDAVYSEAVSAARAPAKKAKPAAVEPVDESAEPDPWAE